MPDSKYDLFSAFPDAKPFMRETLQRAGDSIYEACLRIADLSNRAVGDSIWGTQRMEYLIQAFSLLNQCASLIDAVRFNSPSAVQVVQPLNLPDRSGIGKDKRVKYRRDSLRRQKIQIGNAAYSARRQKAAAKPKGD